MDVLVFGCCCVFFIHMKQENTIFKLGCQILHLCALDVHYCEEVNKKIMNERQSELSHLVRTTDRRKSQT